MTKLIIKREKAFLGMAVSMRCYVNDRVICKLDNGEEKVCLVEDGILNFKCGLPFNKVSDVVQLYPLDGGEVRITVRASGGKPEIQVSGQARVVKEKTALTKRVGPYFGINEDTRQWVAGKGLFLPLEKGEFYDYEDIIDFELQEDGTSVVKGGLGRAVVGAFAFGGLGAVVGGITGTRKTHEKCTSLRIKITVTSFSSPVIYITLLDSATSKDSSAYRKAYQEAQEILSLLQLICASVEPQTTGGGSAADEIRKFKELMDDGIISREEFEEKKRQLLHM